MAGEIEQQIAVILSAGEPTRFRYEGTIRAYLRAARCLQGATWSAADNWARRVVKHALAAIGAQRPSWEDGQPLIAVENLIAWRNCRVCGGPLDDDGDQRRMYCSPECGSIGQNRLARLRLEEERRVGYEAFRAASAKGEEMQRECEQCSKTFTVRGTYVVQRFCGVACANQAQVAAGLERRRRTCPTCGNGFIALHATTEFCSNKCRAAANKLPMQPCAQCGTVFKPKTKGIRFCSRRCAYDNMYPSRRKQSAGQAVA